MNKRHILLVRPDKAGDALKTLPTLRALQRALPEDRFHVLCSRHNASLFAFEKGVRLHILPAGWDRLSPNEIRQLVHGLTFSDKFDIVINLLSDRFPEVETLLDSIPSKNTFSNHLNLHLPENSPAHRNEVTNISLLAGQSVGIDLHELISKESGAPFLSMFDHEEATCAMGKKSGVWLGICPFAGTVNRTHPDKRWQKFFSNVTRFGEVEKYFLFGSKADRMRLLEIRDSAKNPEKVEILFPSSFRTLGAYLQRVDGMIAVDSGPLHLAHALGIPSLGFLSGGDYRRWFPTLRGKDMLVKRGLFNRYPTRWEMVRAFKQWRGLVFQS